MVMRFLRMFHQQMIYMAKHLYPIEIEAATEDKSVALLAVISPIISLTRSTSFSTYNHVLLSGHLQTATFM